MANYVPLTHVFLRLKKCVIGIEQQLEACCQCVPSSMVPHVGQNCDRRFTFAQESGPLFGSPASLAPDFQHRLNGSPFWPKSIWLQESTLCSANWIGANENSPPSEHTL
jgi:hypothetical protein